MSGIRGVDYIAKKGLLKKILAGSYPSGPSSAEPPLIWQMITNNEIPAYNIPSGILFDMHREAAARRPGVLTTVGLDTFVDPKRQGTAMNDKAREAPVVKRVSFEGEDWLYFPAIAPQVAIIRATTADERGNLTYEHEGATLGGLDQALAARNNGGIVIAQVKRIAREGTLKPHDVRVPGVLVDYIVVDPDQKQTTQTLYDPAISGEIFRPLDTFRLPEFNIQKAIARRVAQELQAGSAVNLGFGISANVPRILLEEGLHGAVTWVIEQGAGFDASLLSFLEIGRDGSVNVSKLSFRPHVTAGAGGFVDITARAKKIVFSGMFNAGAKLSVTDGKLVIEKEGKLKKLVNAVEHVTFSGPRGVEQGQDVTYVTDRAVMKLTPQGIVLTEIAPGVDLQAHILDQAEFPLIVSDQLKLMDEALFREEPIGLTLPQKPARKLEA
ncbi:hypothetical protein H721_01975 [Brucella ovis IntaBari-2006-46-332]|nr:hypothetical protein C010_01976 [Brucella ovis 80/125]ENR07033.1 hypothetical protein C961_01949 [Brucella ovis F8/05B]ENS97334.1 hypothetical protein B999_00184 [Brucella ovis 63/96]ENS98012.1 hypothetical protein C009_01984 [Brucella ovis 81/8]ENT77026.1 hypothetical protein H712_01956 [Brucella ovis IntaBari-2009-88-4]ENT79304.1 hypothetical protein H720_01969 [Brucella ovis IntaBari-2006-46-348]ENT82857.1 hypothetical protein H713_01959 [Brucella ovis IntaBari-2010-47-268]ENT87269.1 h